MIGGGTTAGSAAESSVNAFVTFRFTQPNRPDFETSVFSQSDKTAQAVFAVDNLDNYVTSVAIANPNSSPTTVQVAFRDQQGVVFLQDSFTLQGLGNTFFETTNRYPNSTNRRGTVSFTANSGGRVAASCLWFNPTGPFSAIPSTSLTQ